jgi:O-antigen/teichoic acid export membrane protein
MGPVYLGYFSKSHSISHMPVTSIGVSINSVMFSTFSRVQGDLKEVTKWLRNLFTIECVLILPCVLGLFAIAPHFIIVLLGSKWKASIVPLEILSVAAAFNIFNGGLASLNVALGAYKNHTIRTFIGSFILVFLVFIFVRSGLKAVCFAYLTASFLWLMMYFQLAGRILEHSLNRIFKDVWPYCAANLLMVLTVKFCAWRLFPEFSFLSLAALVFIGSLTFILSIFIINFYKQRSIFYPFHDIPGVPFLRTKFSKT